MHVFEKTNTNSDKTLHRMNWYNLWAPDKEWTHYNSDIMVIFRRGSGILIQDATKDGNQKKIQQKTKIKKMMIWKKGI